MGFQRPVFSEEEPTPAVNPSGLLGGFVQPDFVSSLHFLMEPEEIAAIENSEGNDALHAARAPAVRQMAARAYDGVCRMPDGTLHPYIDRGGGYGTTYGAGNFDASGQIAVGAASANGQEPTLRKPGGVGGGGKSGKFTSRASSVARDVTGRTIYRRLEPITGTTSVGGSIARAIPVLGGALMLSDWLQRYYAPECTPVIDPTRIY